MRRKWLLLRKECPSPAQQRKAKERREPWEADLYLQVGTKGWPLSQEAASAWPVRPGSSRSPVPRVEVGVAHPGLCGDLLHAGVGDTDITFPSSSLPGSLALNTSSHPRGPSM